jgi:hypothetical protein
LYGPIDLKVNNLFSDDQRNKKYLDFEETQSPDQIKKISGIFNFNLISHVKKTGE